MAADAASYWVTAFLGGESDDISEKQRDGTLLAN